MLKARTESKQTATLEPQPEQPVIKARSQQDQIGQMFDRFNRGDIYFTEPTQEEQAAASKAYFESLAPAQPLSGPEVLDALFKKAREGSI
jgi:hypothetical protein